MVKDALSTYYKALTYLALDTQTEAGRTPDRKRDEGSGDKKRSTGQGMHSRVPRWQVSCLKNKQHLYPTEKGGVKDALWLYVPARSGEGNHHLPGIQAIGRERWRCLGAEGENAAALGSGAL